jgi:hypothetical protein
MRATQYELLRTGLKALPVITTLGGAATCFLLDMNEVALFESEKFGQHIIRDVIIGGVIGLLGGMAVSNFGQVALGLVNVERDPTYKDIRKAGGGSGAPSTVFKVYDKADIQDNNKSTTKTAQKYAEKEKAEKVERSQILEIGTEGIAQKKRELLGINSPGKPGVSQSGVSQQSSASQSSPGKPGVSQSGVSQQSSASQSSPGKPGTTS